MNYPGWRHSGYFDAPSETQPLLHTWSLAVEEQFYLVYPLLLAGLCRRCRRRTVPGILGLLAVVSFAACVVCGARAPSFNFYMLPTRAWEMLLGGLLTFLPIAGRRAERSLLAEGAALGGLAAIVGSTLFFTAGTPTPGPTTLLPCVGAALLIACGARGRSLVGRLLELPPLVLLGKMSYSLYLWHFPLLVFTRHLVVEADVPGVQTAVGAATLICGGLSWRYVETPFRRRGASLAPRTLLLGWVATAGATAAGGAYLAFSVPVVREVGPTGYVPPPEPIVRLCDPKYVLKLEPEDYRAGRFFGIGPDDESLPVSLLVAGDSHAMVLLPLLDSLCTEHRVRGVAAASYNTLPFVGFENPKSLLGPDCERCQRAVVDHVRAHRIPHVILVANFLNYAETGKDLKLERSLVPEMHRGYRETVAAYRDTGATVWIVRQVPRHRWLVPVAMNAALIAGSDPGRLGLPLPDHRAHEALLAPIFAGPREPHVRLLDPTPFFLDGNGQCRAADGLTALYHDDNHVTDDGADRLRPLFEPIFRGAARRGRPDAGPSEAASNSSRDASSP